jgi:hypothetical protein
VRSRSSHLVIEIGSPWSDSAGSCQERSRCGKTVKMSRVDTRYSLFVRGEHFSDPPLKNPQELTQPIGHTEIFGASLKARVSRIGRFSLRRWALATNRSLRNHFGQLMPFRSLWRRPSIPVVTSDATPSKEAMESIDFQLGQTADIASESNRIWDKKPLVCG